MTLSPKNFLLLLILFLFSTIYNSYFFIILSDLSDHICNTIILILSISIKRTHIEWQFATCFYYYIFIYTHVYYKISVKNYNSHSTN